MVAQLPTREGGEKLGSNPLLTAKVETTSPQFLVLCMGRIYKGQWIGSSAG